MRLLDRLGALAGLAAVLLMTAALFLASPSNDLGLSTGTNSAVLARAYAEHTGPARTAGWCGVAAAFLVLVFAARLFGALRGRADTGDWTPALALLGGAVLAGLALIDAGIAFATSESAGYLADTQVIKAFFLYGWNSTFTYGPPLAAFAVAATAGSFRGGALPRWCGWVGGLVLVLMVAALVGNGAGAAALPGMAYVGFVSLVLAVWPDGQRARETRPSSQTGPSDS